MEQDMESKTPSIIDLNAELAKLTMFRGLTPQTKRRSAGAVARNWALTATVSSLPVSPQGQVIGKHIPRTSWFTFSMARRPWK
jgi:hypothetical protein